MDPCALDGTKRLVTVEVIFYLRKFLALNILGLVLQEVRIILYPSLINFIHMDFSIGIAVGELDLLHTNWYAP